MLDVASFAQRYSEVILALNTLLHELGVPVPLVPTALVAGAQVREGEANAVALVLAITAGTLIGNSVWFAAGRKLGGRVLKTLCKLSLSADSCVTLAESAFTKYGWWALVFGRFLPGVSLVAPPLAGAVGMRWIVFLALTGVGAVFYGTVLVVAGMLFSESIMAVTDAILSHGKESVVAVIALCAIYAASKWQRRRASARELDAPRISVLELKQALAGPRVPVVLDVRGETVRQADRRQVPNAEFTTISEAAALLEGRPKSIDVVVYCSCPNDASAALAVRKLVEAGYGNARALRGGLDAWYDEADIPDAANAP
jgi:membrane protein DedA with SNARE-associated domain/rhodanese-related sulfurtransferase